MAKIGTLTMRYTGNSRILSYSLSRSNTTVTMYISLYFNDADTGVADLALIDDPAFCPMAERTDFTEEIGGQGPEGMNTRLIIWRTNVISIGNSLGGRYFDGTVSWPAGTAVSAPTAAQLASAIAPVNTTLSWSGAQSGFNNPISGYRIEFSDCPKGGSYGNWMLYSTVAGTNGWGSLTVVPSGTSGTMRRFRVAAIGLEGTDSLSGYMECPTALLGNTPPGAPSITYPAAGATCYAAAPFIKGKVGTDAEGDAMTLEYAIDSGGFASLASAGQVIGTLSAGKHTVKLRARDSNGSYSGEVSREFTLSAVSWKRAISAGAVISSATISHRADISELLAAANVARSYYGLAAATLPGTVGRFGDWKAQMAALQTALGACWAIRQTSAKGWKTVPEYPTAAVINELREGVKV